MTRETKLQAYKQALEMHLRAVRNNDPWVGSMEEPRPSAYGLTSQMELWRAEQERKQVFNQMKGSK